MEGTRGHAFIYLQQGKSQLWAKCCMWWKPVRNPRPHTLRQLCPNISPHYISITFAPLHFKYNYICHNLRGFTTWSAPRHYLIECCNIVNRSLKNKPQWNFNLNSNIFIQENAFKSVVCKNGGHLVSAPVCFNWLIATLYLYINMRIRFELVKQINALHHSARKWHRIRSYRIELPILLR